MSGGKRLMVTEVCSRLGVDREFVVHSIRARWVHPAGEPELEFDEEDLGRLELIRDLRTVFGANEESIPIILHLLDQLYELRGRLKRAA